MLYKKLLALEHIKRWNHHPSIRVQNVAAHSYNVAMITAILSRHILKLNAEDTWNQVWIALRHDFSESVTGDISPLVKRFADWEEVEERANIEAAQISAHSDLNELFVLCSDMPPIVKLADYLDAWLFARTEAAIGNRMFMAIRDELTKKIQDLVPMVTRETDSGLTIGQLYEVLSSMFAYDFANASTKDLPEGMSHV